MLWGCINSFHQSNITYHVYAAELSICYCVQFWTSFIIQKLLLHITTYVEQNKMMHRMQVCTSLSRNPKLFHRKEVDMVTGWECWDCIVLKHGLRTPNEAFFHWNTKLLGLGRQFGVFWVLSADLSAPILVLLWVPCPCFSLINHYFYKKLSLYIQIPNIYFRLGFEFGPQIIRDWAIVCS